MRLLQGSAVVVRRPVWRPVGQQRVAIVVDVASSMLRVNVNRGVERKRVGGAGGCHSRSGPGDSARWCWGVIGMLLEQLSLWRSYTDASEGKDRRMRSS